MVRAICREGVALMNAARVRIGRVRMKNGGADVRVIHSNAADTECRQRVRSWAARVMESPGPDAFFAIAFTIDPNGTYQGGLDTTTAWWSARPEIQTDMLPVLATRAVTRQVAAEAAESAIMRELGYARDDDPEPAA